MLWVFRSWFGRANDHAVKPQASMSLIFFNRFVNCAGIFVNTSEN